MRFLRHSLAALATAALLAGCGADPVGMFGAQAGGPLGAMAKQKAHHAGDLALHVLPDEGDGFLLKAVGAAKKSIKLEVYMLTDRDMISALIAAKQHGVAVQVLMEPNPFNPSNPNQPLPNNRYTAKTLQAAGVAVGWTAPTFTFTHAKVITLDDQTTYVSTANFSHSGLSANREFVVADPNAQDVAEFAKIFAADWAHTPYTPADPNLVVSPVNARSSIFKLIQSATTSVQIGVEVAGDPALDALIQTKLKQGVKVQALLSAPFPSSLGEAADSLTERLPEGDSLNQVTARTWMAAGAQVRFQQSPYLHAKYVVVDGRAAYVGSVNLTTNSMDKNRELGLIATQSDVVAGIAAAGQRDWQSATPAQR